MKRLAIMLMALAAATTARGQHISRIACEKGESWWGIFTAEGPMQPFTAPFQVVTGGQGGFSPAPMLFSSLGRYIWSAGLVKVSFDGQAFTIDSASEQVEVQKGGRNLREAYLVCRHKHCPPDPDKAPDPAVFDGPYYEIPLMPGAWGDARSVADYAAGLLKEGFPKGTIVIAGGWCRATGDGWVVDSEYYPDMRAFTDELHGMGFRVMLAVTPFMAASGRSFNALAAKGWLLTDEDGYPVVKRTVTGYNACFDPGKPQAAAAISAFLSHLRTECGVDGVRMDCGEVSKILEGADMVAFTDRWNALGGQFALCHYAPGGSVRREGQVIGLGYEALDAASFERTMYDLIAAGMTGYPYCIPYWRDPYGRERADTAALLNTLAMLPLATVPFSPLQAGDGALCDQLRKTMQRRADMATYIKELAADAARTAEPLVRNMEYAFPRSGFSDCKDQYMIGTKYLVAPMLSDKAMRTVRLPKGTWADAQGKRHRGPLVLEVPSTTWFELVK